MDGKLEKENGRENFFRVCLVGLGRKENKWWGLGVFSPSPSKSFLPKMKRKLKCEKEAASWRIFFCPIPFFFFFFKFIS